MGSSMIPSFFDINSAEQAYLGSNGRPVLGRSLELLIARWSAGERDRETALRLLFLSWYANCEPPFLTGLPTDTDTAARCVAAFAALGGTSTTDPEVCFVVGVMAERFPWALGDEAHWAAVGNLLSRRAALLQPGGPPVSGFAGRGAYGEYFSQLLSATARS